MSKDKKQAPAEDLVGYLYEQYLEKKPQRPEPEVPLDAVQLQILADVQTLEDDLVEKLMASFRETMRTLNPQGLTYVASGMALRLATGRDLALVPPIDADNSAESIGAYQGGITVMGGQGSAGRGGAIQSGDFPLTGAREPRHERMIAPPKRK